MPCLRRPRAVIKYQLMHPQRSAWRLVERTAVHSRFADLYMLPSYEDGWHREFRCGTLFRSRLLPVVSMSAACCTM